MEKYIDADRLKAKLDELYRNYQSKYMEIRTPYTQGLIDTLDLVEQVIDSLQQEQQDVDLEKEKAARLYAIPHYMKDIDLNHIEEYSYDTGLEAAFIVGADWQKKQDEKELSEKIASAYQLGRKDEKEQMMKEAVEGEIINAGYPTKIELDTFYSKFEHGQRVKLIIIKED